MNPVFKNPLLVAAKNLLIDWQKKFLTVQRIVKFSVGIMFTLNLINCNEVNAKNQALNADAAATCYGPSNCKVCKTCNYYKHCNNGGKCSVCK